MLVQIRMLTRGPNRQYRKGQVLTVDSERAARLIESNDAEEVRADGDADRIQGRQGV